jgi:hypothetical protein
VCISNCSETKYTRTMKLAKASRIRPSQIKNDLINKYFIMLLSYLFQCLIIVIYFVFYSENIIFPIPFIFLIMDFDNLLAVECNIKYDQNKLQNILKAFEQRINLMQLHINAVDRRCEHLELSDSTSDRKFGKFESFTIDNLRTTVDQFSSLNSSVSNYLGKNSAEYFKQDGTLIPVDPKH